MTTIEGLLSGAPLLAVGLPLILIGVVSAYLAGIRDRLLLVAVAAPTAVGSLVLAAQVIGSVGLSLPLAVVAVLALLPALLWGQLAGRVFRRRGHRPVDATEGRPTTPWQIWGGAYLGALGALAAWLPGIQDPGLPGQNIDDVWHGYLTRRIADLDAVTAGSMSPIYADRPDPTTFYPYGLHLSAAVVRSLAGAEVATALNSIWPVAVGLMLPFGSALLLRVLLPSRPWAAAYGAMAASAIQFYPYALTGVQPYTVGLAMVPAAAALVVLASRPVAPTPPATAAFLLVVSFIGILVSHPAAGAAFAVVAALTAAEAAISQRMRGVRAVALRLLPAAVAAVVLAQPFLRSAGGTIGTLFRSDEDALMDAASAVRMMAGLRTPWTPAGQYVLGGIVVVGIVACLAWRRRAWSLAVGYVLFVALFAGVVSRAGWPGALVTPWYAEWHRLVGVAMMLAAPLAGVGADTAQDLVSRLFVRARQAQLRSAALAVVVVAVLLALIGIRAIAIGVLRAQSTVASTWRPKLVTPQDVALYREAGNRVPADALVLNNWYDGSGWMYAYGNVRPAVPYTFSAVAWDPVFAHLSDLRPADCRLLLGRNVTHALGKATTLDGTANPLVTAALASPHMFRVEFTGETGTLFSIDQARLRSCANR